MDGVTPAVERALRRQICPTCDDVLANHKVGDVAYRDGAVVVQLGPCSNMKIKITVTSEAHPTPTACPHCPPIDDRCRCPRGMRYHAISCDRYPADHPVRAT